MINVKNLLQRNKITPEQRAALNREVHLLMPELAGVEEKIQARKRQGLKNSKDDSKYFYLQDTLMLMQAGVEIPYKPIAKSYQSVFGDRISDNFKRFIEKLLPAAEEFESSSSSSSSSSKDHAATVLSFSESSPEQVWIFDPLSLISFFIDITIHFICLRTASAKRQRNSNHHHHHHHHQQQQQQQRIMLRLCYRCQKAMINRFGSLINFL